MRRRALNKGAENLNAEAGCSYDLSAENTPRCCDERWGQFSLLTISNLFPWVSFKIRKTSTRAVFYGTSDDGRDPIMVSCN